MTFPIAPNESERLATLQKLNILDTGAELPFDTITEIARTHFAVPIVAISLIDEERQWFKSHPGLDACQTDRDVAFCNYTIMSDDIFEVTNAAEHPAFKENPLVTLDLHLRYYCGAPILVSGIRVGALCLIDQVSRTALLPPDRQLLKDLAYLTAHLITTHRMIRESTGALVSLLK